MPKCHSHHALIVQICCHSHYVNMTTSGDNVYLLLHFVLLLNYCVMMRETHDPYKFEQAFNLMSKGVSRAQISRILDILF